MPADLLEITPTPASAAPIAIDQIRVLHVINGEHYSGAERVQDLLGLRLPQYGVIADFAALKPGKFAAMRRAEDCQVHQMTMRSRFDLRAVIKLARLIREQNYRIVHTHTARSALVGHLAARWCGVPHVHHLHSPTACDTTRWMVNRGNMAIEYVSLRGADAIIPVSHTLGEYAKQHGVTGQLLRVVPNGVPVHGPLAARRTPQGAWVLGTVALFRPRKGLEVLLAAVARLRSQGLPVRLRAVGGFETEAYEQEIKSLADQLGITTAIDWTGFTRNVSGELAKMDLFVLPSLFGEGLPMVMLEAMAAGVPIVATRVEGVPEALRDTIDGLLTTPGDVNDLVARVSDFITGRIDWQAVRIAAHARQAQMFSDRSMAAGVAQVYRQVLENRQLKKNSIARRLLEPINFASDEADEITPHEVTIMGTRIDSVSMAQAVQMLIDCIDAHDDTPRAQVSFVNADCINLSYRDEAYRQVLADSQFVFADGIGMKIAGRVLGQTLVDNVNGTDLFPRLCMALAKRGARLYLLGAQPGVADDVARWVKQFFPKLTVCGTRDGYFSASQLPGALTEIRESRPDVLLVALGAPRQEKWIAQNLPQLGCRVALGVGGLFDFYSQRVPRAPKWMRETGLEWCYRLLQQPRRLAGRYLLGNPLFMARLALCKLRGDRTPLPPTPPARYDSDFRYEPAELASANA
jgi:exopolysaccharide biosynthesis WecB/TagA/CpsF family protein